MHVCLFDIDGTLLNTGGAGQEAMERAFVELFAATHDGTPISLAGRTDAAITRDFFGCYQVECTPENQQRLHQGYLQFLPETLAGKDGLVLPGVPELLETLHQRDDMLLGLLTGNFEAGARLKLEYYEIDHYFTFGGFGDRHADRADVARHAVEQAHERHPSGQFESERVWVIGDTVGDVTAGRAIGARVVAVGTGFCDNDLLKASQPDFYFEDFSDLDAVLELFE